MNIYHLNGLTLNLEKGRINLSASLFLRSFVEFSYEWLKILFSILIGFKTLLSKYREPATLIYGLGSEATCHNGSDKRFKDFCQKGPITPLNTAKWLIVQNKYRPFIYNDKYNIQYASCPIATLVSSGRLLASDRIGLLISHFKILMQYIFIIFKCPLMSLLGRDIAFIPAIQVYDKQKQIENIIITNSNYYRQPLWMREPKNRKFRVHEVLYSQNTKPFVYAQDKLKSDSPALRHITVDEHWVWTEGYKSYLEGLGQKGLIHVVGSIMFYLPDNLSTYKSSEINIGIFDVTPVYPYVADKLGIINNYHSTDTMIGFLSDIIVVCKKLEDKSGKKIKVQLKHKRYFHESHDIEYFNYCKNLEDSGDIEVIDYDVNVYQFVKSCSIVVSIPYTSAAYIACEMGVSSLYYDCTNELKPTFESLDKLCMASDVVDLKNKICEVIC